MGIELDWYNKVTGDRSHSETSHGLCKHFYFYSDEDGKPLQAIEQRTDIIYYPV